MIKLAKGCLVKILHVVFKYGVLYLETRHPTIIGSNAIQRLNESWEYTPYDLGRLPDGTGIADFSDPWSKGRSDETTSD